MRTSQCAVASAVAALVLPSGCAASPGTTTPESRATPTPGPFESHRLDCDGGRSTIWSTDPGKPAPDATIADAIDGYPGAQVVMEGETGARAVVADADGRVVSTLVLVRWHGDSGGWYVESGSDCRRERGETLD